MVAIGRGRRITDDERAVIISLYQGGMPMRRIADQTERSYGAINTILHQARGQGVVEVQPRGGRRRAGSPASSE